MKFLLFVVVLVGAVCGFSAQGQELRIVAKVGERVLPLHGFDGSTIQVRDGERLVPAPPTRQWNLEGDVRSSVTLFHWLADSTIRWHRNPDADILADPLRPLEVDVYFRNGPGLNGDGLMVGGQIFAVWPELARPAALVAVWLVGSEVDHIEVLPMPNPKATPEFTMVAKHFLTRADASRCRVGLGLAIDGRLIAPRAAFGGPMGAAVLEALVFDDSALLEKAFTAGASPRMADNVGTPLVRIATQVGAHGVLTTLLRMNPVLRDDRTSSGETLLHLATYFARAETASTLLRAGAPVNPHKKNDMTPIRIAASYGHAELVKLLLAAGAPPDETQPGYPRMMGEAVASGDVETAALLSQAGANLGSRYLLVEAAMAGRTAMVRWLCQNLGKKTVFWAAGEALGYAASSKTPDSALAELLLATGVSPEAMDGVHTETPLTNVCLHGGFAFAETLLAHGAKIDATNKDRSTALHRMAAADLPDAVRFLVAHGASLQIRDAEKHRALDLALLGHSTEVAKALDALGDRIDLTQAGASQLVGIAVRLDLPGLLQKALQDGWSPNTELAAGWSALRVAAIGGGECEKLLRSAGAGDGTGQIPLEANKALDAPLQMLKSPALPYPQNAPDRALLTLSVEAVIDSNGRVLFPRFKVRPEGTNMAKIMAAIGRWRFAPPTSQGKPVALRIVLPAQIRRPEVTPGQLTIGP